MSASKTEQVNLANQREAAIAFLDMQGGVEKIHFTQEGGYPGFGASWRASALVTVSGEDYRAILGPNLISSNPLPSIPPTPKSVPVTIVYSDGSSEVLE